MVWSDIDRAEMSRVAEAEQPLGQYLQSTSVCLNMFMLITSHI